MLADRAISSFSVRRGSSQRLTRFVTLAGLAVVILLAACGGGLVRIHNVRAPVRAPRGQAPSAQHVRDVILSALVSRSWQVDREGPDGIVATIVSRGHSATVLIQFDVNSYAISYLDSSPGLKFNGSAIHRRYNEWIERLDASIRQQFATGDPYAAKLPASMAPPAAGAQPAQPVPAAIAEPAPTSGPAPAPPPAGAPPVAAPGGPYEAPPPPPPPATAPRR